MGSLRSDLTRGTAIVRSPRMVKFIAYLLPSLTMLPLVCLARVSNVHACFVIPGIVDSRQTIPADGSTGVPTNVRIVLAYNATSPGVTDRPRLQSADGVEITVDVTQPLNRSSTTPNLQTFVMVPAAPLAPNTKYKVLSDFGTVPCQMHSMGTGGTPPCFAGIDGGAPAIAAGAASAVAIANFTTGKGPDNDVPELPGVLTYIKGTSISCNDTCCSPHLGYLGYTVGFNWDKATDASGFVYYQMVYEQSTIFLPVFEAALDPSTPTAAKLVGSLNCFGAHSLASFVARPGLFQVFAVDLAGNRSNPISVTVANDCGGILNAGVDGLPGSGGVSGSSPNGDDRHDAASGGSCRLGGGQDGIAGFALFALGMLLTRRLRRCR